MHVTKSHLINMLSLIITYFVRNHGFCICITANSVITISVEWILQGWNRLVALIQICLALLLKVLWFFSELGTNSIRPKTTVGVIHSSLGLHNVFIEFMRSTFLRYVISKYVKKMHTIFFITPCISPRHQYHYLLSALLLIFVYRADTGYTLEKSNLL